MTCKQTSRFSPHTNGMHLEVLREPDFCSREGQSERLPHCVTHHNFSWIHARILEFMEMPFATMSLYTSNTNIEGQNCVVSRLNWREKAMITVIKSYLSIRDFWWEHCICHFTAPPHTQILTYSTLAQPNDLTFSKIVPFPLNTRTVANHMNWRTLITFSHRGCKGYALENTFQFLIWALS